MSGNALVTGRASVYGGHILDKAIIKGKAKVIESTIYGSAVVQDNTRVNNSTVGDTSVIKDNAVLDDRATEEFWDKFLSLARMFQNENVKVKDPWK